MTMSAARRLGGLAALAVLVAACTDSSGDADTSGTEPDLTANVVTIPPVPATTPPTRVSTTAAAAPDDRPSIVDLTGEIPLAGGSIAEIDWVDGRMLSGLGPDRIATLDVSVSL